MKSFFLHLVSDEHGNISSARFLNVLVGVCSCLMMWKMVLMHEVTGEMWAAWLAYGAGVYSFGKWVEGKKKDDTTKSGT